MYRIASSARLAFLLAAATTASAYEFSNVLKNAGFEDGAGGAPSDWQRFAAATRDAVTNRSGTQAGKLTGDGAHDGNGAGFYQDFTTQPGQVWRAAAWAMNRSADPIQGTNHAILSIEFYDAQTNKYWAPQCPEWVTKDTPQDEWTGVSVEAVSPLLAKTVRFLLIYWQMSKNDGGSVWFDDCAFGLAPTTTLRFAGREWGIRSWDGPPGPNPWSTNNAWVDTNGFAHLQITKVGNRWYCAELECLDSLGYGEYLWKIASRVDLLDTNAVGGFFVFAPTERYGDIGLTNELDIEFNRSFENTGATNLVYSVQPWINAGNQHTRSVALTNSDTVHTINWTPGEIRFTSFYGTGAAPSSVDHLIDQWLYKGEDVPFHSVDTPRMNLWLYKVLEPADTQHLEVLVRDFVFTPFSGALLTDDFADNVQSSLWGRLAPNASQIRETNGLLQVSPDGNWITAAYATTNTVNWNDKRERFVFSANLATVIVQTASSGGEDVRAILTLSSAFDNGWGPPNALNLQAQYDVNNDTMVFALFTKTNKPSSDGDERFNATLQNASSYWGGGRQMCITIELCTNRYRLRLADHAGATLPITTNSGSITGLHNLSNLLHHAHWIIGAQNSGSGRGWVCWDSTAVGVSLPPATPALAGAAFRSSGVSLSWASQFDTRYTVHTTTNLSNSFTPLCTNILGQPPLNAYTDAPSAPAIFYRISAKQGGE